MSDLLRRVLALVARGEVVISGHGYDELASDDILVSDVLESIHSAAVVEEYPDYFKGPCVLVLQQAAHPIHVLWGVPRNSNGPAVMVTAYRPDPNRWSADFRTRKP